jgi:hypothetical protein
VLTNNLFADPRPSPGLALNLSSNNPFRNRATSPHFSSGLPSPAFDPPPRPQSRNPFLDTSATDQPLITSPDKMSFSPDTTAPRPALTGNAAELFVRHPSSTLPRLFDLRMSCLQMSSEHNDDRTFLTDSDNRTS